MQRNVAVVYRHVCFDLDICTHKPSKLLFMTTLVFSAHNSVNSCFVMGIYVKKHEWLAQQRNYSANTWVGAWNDTAEMWTRLYWTKEHATAEIWYVAMYSKDVPKAIGSNLNITFWRAFERENIIGSYESADDDDFFRSSIFFHATYVCSLNAKARCPSTPSVLC